MCTVCVVCPLGAADVMSSELCVICAVCGVSTGGSRWDQCIVCVCGA